MLHLENKTIKVGISIGIYIFIFVAFHIFVARPFIFGKLSQEENNYKELQKKLTQSEKLIRLNPDPKKKLKEIKKKMEEFEKKAASERELPRIIQQLTKKSSQLNIEIISIRPRKDLPFKEEKLPTGVSKEYVEVVLRTPYKTLGEYLRALEELPIVFTIESLLIEGEELEEELSEKERGAREIIATLLISSYTVFKI
jgi:Tfp pilus assembly protein PilO